MGCSYFSIPHLNTFGIVYPVIVAATANVVTYYNYIGTNIGHHNYVYTNLLKIAVKSKTKDYNIHNNDPLIVLVYWLNIIEEYFTYIILTSSIYQKN